MDYTESPETLAQSKTDRVCVISLAACLVAALAIWAYQTMATGHAANDCAPVKTASGTAGKNEQAVFVCSGSNTVASAK